MTQCFKLLYAAFAAFVLLMPLNACAQWLYDDENYAIPWPDQTPYTDCDDALKAKAGVVCRRLGVNGDQGAVFMTVHHGYALGSVDALSDHLKNSEDALANITNIHVMQARILNEKPLVGMIDIMRKDGTLQDIQALQAGDIRQTSFLIPSGDMLAQVFVYLPMNADYAMPMLESFMLKIGQETVVRLEPEVKQAGDDEPVEGALALMPRALWAGGAIAAFVILVFSIKSRIDRRRRREEDRKLQIQLEACSNASEDACSEEQELPSETHTEDA